MKSQSSLVVIWLLFILVIFSVGYITTHLIVTRVMADFRVEPTTNYNQWLEVKDNYGTQTDNHYKVQPAEGFTLEELNGFTKVTEL